MKEKILNEIHKKLSEGFNTKFLSKKEFEKEFAEHHKTILDELISQVDTYNKLKETSNAEVIKIQRKDFILQQFNSNRYRYDTPYTDVSLATLEKEQDYAFNEYAKNYDWRLENGNEDIIVSLIDFMLEKIEAHTKLKDGESDLALPYLFWNYFKSHEDKYRNKYETAKLMKSPVSILVKFGEDYLSNTFIQLLDRASIELADEPLSSFDPFIVNVGIKSYEHGRAGWTTFYYKIYNNKKQHAFSSSLKDEKAIGGEFINVFVFQTKYLIKFSISISEVEVNRYIIYRDCEKVAVKNECELVISKHHGNETIIFDTKKEAVARQLKLLEARDGRMNGARR